MGCVVPVLLKLLHTTETTDKLLAYGPPQLLKGLLGVAIACMHAELFLQNLCLSLDIYGFLLKSVLLMVFCATIFFSRNPCRIINKIMKNA